MTGRPAPEPVPNGKLETFGGDSGQDRRVERRTMETGKTEPHEEMGEAYRYDSQELDLMDEVELPRLNPLVSLLLLVLAGFAYVWIWGALLQG